MIGGMQVFVLIVSLEYYGMSIGPYASFGECEAARLLFVKEMSRVKRSFAAFCLPGPVEEKR